MFTEAVGGLVSAAEIYEKRTAVAQLFKRLLHQFMHGTVKVGVVGAGGTGKTTFGLLTSGALDTDKSIDDYVETIGTDRFRVSGERSVALTIVPGQKIRRASTWAEIYQSLSSGQSTRVINVVAWGYHASGLEKERHRAYEIGMSDDDFRRAYLVDSRSEEIEALAEIVPHLNAAPGRLRMLTLVTKQDLWWKKRHEVNDHYKVGNYAKHIASILQNKGEANFSHDFVSCALVEQNLRMIDDFSIAETVGGYDDMLRVANLDRMVKTLNQFLGD